MIIHLGRLEAAAATASVHAFIVTSTSPAGTIDVEAGSLGARLVLSTEREHAVVPLGGRILRGGDARVELRAGRRLLAALDGERSLLTVQDGSLHASTSRPDGWVLVGSAPLLADPVLAAV